jgi:LacI family transcriptional regulator
VKAEGLTIRDVANLAGVSIATVSHVVNDTGNVGSATRHRIRRLIQIIGYAPNVHARELASRRVAKSEKF